VAYGVLFCFTMILGAMVSGCNFDKNVCKMEKEMGDNYLYRHEMDDNVFPELKFGFGKRGIRIEFIQGKRDDRISAPPDVTALLLVVFRLPETGDPSIVWQLDVEVDAEKGEHKVLVFPLLDAPVEGNVSECVAQPANQVIPPGLIFQGAFWVDLSDLCKRDGIVSGQRLFVRYGKDNSSIVVPAVK